MRGQQGSPALGNLQECFNAHSESPSHRAAPSPAALQQGEIKGFLLGGMGQRGCFHEKQGGMKKWMYIYEVLPADFHCSILLQLGLKHSGSPSFSWNVPGLLLQWFNSLRWAEMENKAEQSKASFKEKKGPGTHPKLMLLFRRTSSILLLCQPFESHQQFPFGVWLLGITIKIFCRLNNCRLK